jgi:Mrp family chromosome partitioning ATPase
VSSRVYDWTRWTDGPGVVTRLVQAGRLVTRTLGGAFDPVEETRSRHFGEQAKREDAGAPVQGDLAELAKHEEIKLVQRVFLAPGLEARRAVLFAGVERDNGCARLCVQAGQTLARLAPQSVGIVDANVRSPVLHEMFDRDDHDRLAAAVGHPGAGCHPGGGCTFARRLAPDNLWLLPAGSASASDPDLLLTADRARACLQESKAQFDRLIVNAPPINLYAESLALSQFVDGVVLVLEANVTRREIVRNVKTHLEDLNVPLLGIVLNNRTFPIPEAVYRLV